jgi:hypothetical protein
MDTPRLLKINAEIVTLLNALVHDRHNLAVDSCDRIKNYITENIDDHGVTAASIVYCGTRPKRCFSPTFGVMESYHHDFTIVSYKYPDDEPFDIDLSQLPS